MAHDHGKLQRLDDEFVQIPQPRAYTLQTVRHISDEPENTETGNYS